MKLSEAIRLGAKIRPQCFGDMFKDGCSCALGAAYEGLTGKNEWSGCIDKHPINILGLRDVRVGHPVSNKTYSLSFIIAYLNDRYGWTREKIADWLESKGF